MNLDQLDKPQRGILCYEVIIRIDPASNAAHISSIWVAPEFRGRRLGLHLLGDALRMALMHRVSIVELDDMSDAYRKVTGNLYLSTGFTYKDNTGCEMVGDIRQILKCIESRLCKEALRVDIRKFRKKRVRVQHAATARSATWFCYTHRGFDRLDRT